jgi:hypothetical protein
MDTFSRLIRSALFAVTLAYVLALAGMAGARVMSAHVGEVHAFAALKVICSEHGLAAPVGGPVDNNHSHSDCPCGPGCAFKTFGSTARHSVTLVWSPADATSVFYATTSFLPVGSRAPPDLTARGPPILI